MAKKSTKKARTKKQRAPRKISIEVGKKDKPTLEDIELAIKKKLAAERTDFFRNTDTVMIVIEDDWEGRDR